MRRRLSCLAVIAAVAALAGWGWYATRPKLVWWTSPALTREGHQLRVKIPVGWRLKHVLSDECSLRPGPPSLPGWLVWLNSRSEYPDRAILGLRLVHSVPVDESEEVEDSGGYFRSIKAVNSRDNGMVALSEYIRSRSDKSAFESTHRAICNSLRILEPGEK